MKCSIALVYEAYPKTTFESRLKVLVKRQLIREAEAALHEAQELGDDVLVASFQGGLQKLQSTLDLVIPPEVERLYVEEDERRGTN